jgi:hypothetical protein
MQYLPKGGCQSVHTPGTVNRCQLHTARHSGEGLEGELMSCAGSRQPLRGGPMLARDALVRHPVRCAGTSATLCDAALL